MQTCSTYDTHVRCKLHSAGPELAVGVTNDTFLSPIILSAFIYTLWWQSNMGLSHNMLNSTAAPAYIWQILMLQTKNWENIEDCKESYFYTNIA